MVVVRKEEGKRFCYETLDQFASYSIGELQDFNSPFERALSHKPDDFKYDGGIVLFGFDKEQAIIAEKFKQAFERVLKSRGLDDVVLALPGV